MYETDTIDESVETQDVADPVGAEVETASEEPVEESENTQEVADPVKTDENARYAAARREAEKQLRDEIARRDRRIAERFKGFTNPITGKEILTEEDYLDALDAQETVRARRELEEKGIDPKLLDAAVERNPLIRQAQQVIAQSQQSEAQRMLEEDLKEIMKLDSSVKSLEEVYNSPDAQKMIDICRTSGLRLSDAYKLVRFDSLRSSATTAAKQAAINQAKGKDGLIPTSELANNSTGGKDIPESELSLWKEAFPGASLAELKAKYNKIL